MAGGVNYCASRKRLIVASIDRPWQRPVAAYFSFTASIPGDSPNTISNELLLIRYVTE